MENHTIVRCCSCGRDFDITEGGFFDQTVKGYVCPFCVQALSGQPTGRNSPVPIQVPQVTAKTPFMGATVAKVIGGISFAAVIPEMEGSAEALMALGFALALFAWAAWPWVRLHRQKAAKKAAEEAIRQYRREQAEAAAGRALNRRSICPNCGAPATGHFCEYCGAPLDPSR